jgi:hypothetical protein
MTNGATRIAPFGEVFAAQKGVFLQLQRGGHRRRTASSRRAPWNDGFGVLGGKLDDLERFAPLLGVPQVVLDLLAKPTLSAGVKGDG